MYNTYKINSNVKKINNSLTITRKLFANYDQCLLTTYFNVMIPL